MLKKILITGGIGSGKSYISDIFNKYDIPLFSFDDEAKLILEYIDIRYEIVKILNTDILDYSGKIDKVKIANIIFNDDQKREQLEKLFKPHLMFSFYEQCYEQEYKKNKTLFVSESAIMLKSKSYKMFDEVIYIDADINKRKDMVMKHRNMSSYDFDKRFEKQLSTEESISILEKNNMKFIVFNNEYDSQKSEDFVKNYINNNK